MIRTSHTLTNNKIYSLPISIDERYKYSLTSVSKNKLRYEVHSKRTRPTWGEYREVRNKIKQKINKTKTPFYKNILNSKKAKDMWKIVHHIFNSKSTTLEKNINDANELCNSTAARVTG